MNWSRIVVVCLLVGLTVQLGGCKKQRLNNRTNDIVPTDFLTEDDYNELVVEIVYVDGFAPNQAAIARMQTFLEARLHKSGGITVELKSIPSPGISAYSIQEIKDIEIQERKSLPKGKTLTAFFFYADAGYEEDSGNLKVLGVAYGTTSMVLFAKTINDYAGGIGQPSNEVLEATVLNHEFGHILGLVNNGVSPVANHQDVAHGAHCTQSSCLMYYTAETSDIIANLVGGVVPQLDSQCIADLQAAGGK